MKPVLKISEIYPVQGIYNPVRKSRHMRKEWRAKPWLFISMMILSVAQSLNRTGFQGDLLGFGSHLHHVPITSMWPRARCFILLSISCLIYKMGSIGFDPWVKMRLSHNPFTACTDWQTILKDVCNYMLGCINIMWTCQWMIGYRGKRIRNELKRAKHRPRG